MFLSLFERLRKLEYQYNVQFIVQHWMCSDFSASLIEHIYYNTLKNDLDRTVQRPIEIYIMNFSISRYSVYHVLS